MAKFAQCFGWVDIETTSLPKGNDFSDVHILEFALILTDFELNKYAAYHEVAKPTAAAVEVLRANPEVVKMHQESGLMVDLKTATYSLADIEKEAIQLIKDKTSFDPGEIMIAGSGVGAFDFALIKEKMPELAKWFAYYPGDVGVFRRLTKILSGGKTLYNPVASSYAAGTKKHRALADAEAHLEEAVSIQKWLRSL